ncbi:Hsp20/alpha crystallin family protein [Natrononativus amylolyticus]|uniref:Hsp20/alpha crystallin family protein n=1 Tax=Natrononativus amylolyticus TaxID=2963434 RepID=UPI0020CB6D9C|nr:Hsp20/alpha crystallin family protein [Natrononativus amylolyticus]
MSNNGNGDDEQESETPPEDDRGRGFHLEAGLRPLSDLLGSLVEVDARTVPPPSADPVEWTNVDENEPPRPRERSEPRRKRTRRVRRTSSDQCLLDTRRTDGVLVVTADVPGASKDDISVGRNPRTNELVISKEGSVVGRVDLPWESPEVTKVWFNNGVLEVHVRSDGG